MAELVLAIEEKLRFRKGGIAGIEDRILAKEARLRALWVGRLANQMAVLPEFNEVFRSFGLSLGTAESAAGGISRLTASFVFDLGQRERAIFAYAL